MALTVSDVHRSVKDQPEFNVLLEQDRQSGDPMIKLAFKLAVSDFNSLPPASSYTQENFPNDAVLLYGVLFYLANGEAERQLRNQVNYNAQGLSVNLDDKFAQYNQLAQFYSQMFTRRSSELKKNLNIDAAWGQVSSPYAEVNQWDYRS